MRDFYYEYQWRDLLYSVKELAAMEVLRLKQRPLLLLCQEHVRVVEEKGESKRIVLSRNGRSLCLSNGGCGEAKQKTGKAGSSFDLGVSRLLAPRLLQTASRPCHHQQLRLHPQNRNNLAQTRRLLVIVQ
jgi:hypothetical protein